MPTGQFPNVAYAWITTIGAVWDFSNLAVANTPTAEMRSTSRATFIPYRLWRWTHRLMGVFIAVGAFEYLFVLKPFSLFMSLSQGRLASPQAIQVHPRSVSGPRPSSPGQS